ncbi:MAG: acetyl-CoA C-acetyltransferase [Actinomycetota bacterium]
MIDEDRIPVVVATAQRVERVELIGALDLAERVAVEALDQAPGLRPAIGRLSVVGILSPTGPAPATALAKRLGLTPGVCETTSIGGNTPQLLVTRAAADIAAGRLDATLIAGAEAMRSAKAGHRGLAKDAFGDPDPAIGDDRLGTGDAENAVGLILPVHIYAMIESAIAARAGNTFEEHRARMGRLLAPFSEVAATHPVAWFPERRTADEIATPSPDNRIVAEPYTKRMTAILNVDQGAAVVVCSLAAARAAGVADRAVFVWSGADCHDVWEPVARPDLTTSPAIAAAADATLGAHGLGVDDVAAFDLYSCFPAAVEAATEAIGLAPEDPRGLTVTGGLPYFGGPGNNYSTHGIATMVDRLRTGDEGACGLVSALGWYTTKHSYGLYGTSPPPSGFVNADLSARQRDIDATALPVAMTADGEGTVVASTVVYDGESAAMAPIIATLDDGRRVVAAAAPGQLPSLSGRNVVGERVRVTGQPLSYEVIA